MVSSLAVAVLQFLPTGLRPHLGKLVVLPCLKAREGQGSNLSGSDFFTLINPPEKSENIQKSHGSFQVSPSSNPSFWHWVGGYPSGLQGGGGLVGGVPQRSPTPGLQQSADGLGAAVGRALLDLGALGMFRPKKWVANLAKLGKTQKQSQSTCQYFDTILNYFDTFCGFTFWDGKKAGAVR